MTEITTSKDELHPDYVKYEDFAKMSIRIGTVKAVEEIPKSSKLLKLTVEITEHDQRTILAGIKQQYTAERLLNTQIVVLTNLEPRKMFGFTSQGMLLAVDVDDKAILLRPDNLVPNGSKIR